MSDCVVYRAEDGKLAGFGAKGSKRWVQFCEQIAQLGIGETMQFSWRLPRSPSHHRMFFAKLGALMDIQEQFDTDERLRAWLTVGAGYADFVPGPTGRMVALPQSIAFDKLDEVAFTDLHQRVDAFLWGDHARRFLWPHMSDLESYDMVAEFFGRFA